MAIVIGSKLDELYCNGKRACQHESIILCLDKLFAEISNISRIIEIGTAGGGFAELLRSYDVCQVETWDVKQGNSLSPGIIGIAGDCFEFEPYFQRSIEEEGRCLLFCDGGDKAKEFNTFAKYLKQGDIIFAHDYCKSREIFIKDFKDKIWNWIELTYDDIKDTIYRYQLNPFMEEDFSKAVWASFIR